MAQFRETRSISPPPPHDATSAMFGIYEYGVFQEMAPRYDHTDMPWEMFLDLFMCQRRNYRTISDKKAKRVLYMCLRGRAQQWAFYWGLTPINFETATFEEYAEELGKKFKSEPL